MCAWGRPFLVNAITDKLEYCRNMAEESSIALPPGVKLGKYRILRMIGQGGFGFTYLAVDTSTETECVIKEHFPDAPIDLTGPQPHPDFRDDLLCK